MKFCMVQTKNFTQLCCSKHYSVVRAWKFEFFFIQQYTVEMFIVVQ